MRKVAVITASRADFGNYLPLLNAIGRHRDLELSINPTGDTSYIPETVKFQARQVYQSMPSDYYDWLVVSGDTMPMLKACLWAAEHNIPIVHLGGGDSTTGACIDEQIRHAITRFAHLHFTQTQTSAERLIKMGEEPWRVQVSGPLGIYAMPDAEFIPEKELRAQLCLSDKPIVIVIQHPVSSQVEEAGEQMRITLEAVSQIPDIQPVIIYPNGEAGSEAMIQVIKEYQKRLPTSYDLAPYKNIPFLTFQSLLKYSSVIVGNSSCAIVEAPFYGVPAVNVGIRQEGREHADNLWNANHNSALIKTMIESVFNGIDTRPHYSSPFQRNPTGIQKIITALVDTPIDEKLMRKRLTF